MKKVEKAVGYFLLSFNEVVDTNKGLFDEEGNELPSHFINIAHHVEVRFSDLEEMRKALTKVKRSRSHDFLLPQDVPSDIKNNKFILTHIVLDKALYDCFTFELDRDVYEKYKGSYVKSGSIDIKIDHLDYVVNSHINADSIQKDFAIGEGALGRKVDMNSLEEVKAKMLFVADGYGIKPVAIEDFVDVKSEIEWKCCKGHVFTKGYKGIVQRTSKSNICPYCQETKRGAVMKDAVKEFAEKNLLDVDIEDYETIHTKLKWTCQVNKNHVTVTTYSSMKHTAFACRKCGRRNFNARYSKA